MTSPALPVLYSFRRCPYAIRSRMALHYAGIEVTVREVALGDKPADFVALSSKATVPVLQLPSGDVIDQSLAIMQWALQQNDPQGWLRLDANDEALHWIALNDEVFKTLLDHYKYATRHPEQPASVHRAAATSAFIAPLNQRLLQAPYLFGTNPSLADLALFPFVRQFAFVDKAWFDAAPLAGVQAWLTAWLESELFAAVMLKHPTVSL
ncbi:MAG: glutathione S-transferase [Burkholderiaceae bacterium]